MFKTTTIIFSLLFVVANTSHAQLPQQLNFRNLTEKDGLSNNKISSIVQDENGIIWIGTNNGLNRYDGNRVKTFYKDDSGIPFGEISSLHATENGLWICTPSQVFYMQTRSERSWILGKFVNAVIYKDNLEYKLVDQNNIYKLPTDAQIENKNFFINPVLKRNINLGFNDIIYDRQKQPWSFYKNKIFRLNKQSLAIEKEYASEGLQIQMIYFDSKDRCWVASWGNGVFMFDPANGSIKQFNIENNNFVVLGLNSWKQMDKDYLVISSDNSMILVDETNLQYKKYENNGRFLSRSSFSDKDNNLWLACDNGVRMISQRQDFFSVIPIIPSVSGKPDWISGVYTIKETANNFWLSKRYLAGIFQYDKNWHLKKYWPYLTKSVNDNQKNDSREAFDFLEENGLVYITTENGIYMIDSTSKVELLVTEVNENAKIRLRNIEQENDSTWWIRSYNSGIYIFNPKKGKMIKHYSLLDNNNLQQPIHYMLRTKKGEVFVTTYYGLYKLNDSHAFVKIPTAGAPSDYMMGMAEDKNGIVWIASSKGMFAFDPASQKIFKLFNEFQEMGFCYRVTV
ncbi:MAG: two-component regulator propeller domain-containing protein, partial [Ferruginibacter sp.]